MTVLIAGVGYIGAPLALACLARGESVVGLDNFFCTSPRSINELRRHPRFRLIRGSISSARTLDTVLAYGPYSTIHLLAAQPSANPRAASVSYTERTNLIGPRMLLDLATVSGSPRIVLGSSFHVYGTPLTGCVDETRAFGSFSDMSHLSKVYVEKLLEMYTRSHSLTGVSVRLGIVYGLGLVMKSNPLFLTVPNLFARRAACGEPLEINAQASAPMGFIHLDDAVSALLAAERLADPYTAANAATEALTIREVAFAVRDAARERQLNVAITPAQNTGEKVSRFTASSRLQEIGWSPTERLRDRVGEVIDYAREGKWPEY
ncbi:MAG TPA: NAD(P)-dependent oxidoreductase [Chloroflexota bacterium]|nr:NAD(P)-dependent oxidoreductase [Chloroflexota bacterium]